MTATEPAKLYATRTGQVTDGLTWLKALKEGKEALPPVAEFLGFEVHSVEPGLVTFSIEPSPLHYNPMGVVHGGVTATLLDTVMACSVLSMLPAGMGCSSLDISVRYLRSITARTGAVLATGTVTHRGRRTAAAEARLVAKRGKMLLATSSSTLVMTA